MLKVNGVYIVEDIAELNPNELKLGNVVTEIPKLDEYDETPEEGEGVAKTRVNTLVLTQVFGNVLFRFDGNQTQPYTYPQDEEDIEADFQTESLRHLFLKIGGTLKELYSSNARNCDGFKKHNLNGAKSTQYPGELSVGTIDRTEFKLSSEHVDTGAGHFAAYYLTMPLSDGASIVCELRTHLSHKHSYSSHESVYIVSENHYVDVSPSLQACYYFIRDLTKDTDGSVLAEFNRVRGAYKKLSSSNRYMFVTSETRSAVVNALQTLFKNNKIEPKYLMSLVTPIYTNGKIGIDSYLCFTDWGGGVALTRSNDMLTEQDARNDKAIYDEYGKARAIASYLRSGTFNPFTGEFDDQSQNVTLFKSISGIICEDQNGRKQYFRTVDDIYVYCDTFKDKEIIDKLEQEQALVLQLQE